MDITKINITKDTVVTNETIEYAKTQLHYQEAEQVIWETHFDGAKINEAVFSSKTDAIKQIGSELNRKKPEIDKNVVDLEGQLTDIEAKHTQINSRPQSEWSNDEKRFMNSFDQTKDKIEAELAKAQEAQRKLDADIAKNEELVALHERQLKSIQEHIKNNIEAKVEVEREETGIALSNLEALKEELDKRQNGGE